MRIISRKKINDFCKKHPKAKNSLDNWYRIVRHENFKTFTDVRQLFPNADLVNNFIVFNIGGNNYRLIAFIDYPKKQLFIRYILTHGEYDKEKWKQDNWFRTT